MVEEKIKYTDYNGNELTETFYFNISKAEMMRMQMGHTGGYDEYLKRIISSKDSVATYKAFEDLIKLSYGVKSEDGKYFMKRPEDLERFMQSEAYSELIFSFFNDTNRVLNFVKGIMPKEIRDKVKEDELKSVMNE
jgi:hypothetical protein